MEGDPGDSVEQVAAPLEKTRILYYISYPHRMAGANRSLFELITNLPRSVRPLVAIVADGPVAAAYRAAGIETHIVQPGRSLAEFGRSMFRWSPLRRTQVFFTEHLPYILFMTGLLRRLRINIVHVNDVRGALLIGPAARLARRPLIGHLRGDISEVPFGAIPRRVFERATDAIITVCSSIQSSLSPFARSKAATVYNGIAGRNRDGTVASRWLNECRTQGMVVVSCFASIVPFKGHWALLDCVADLNRRGWRHRTVFLCIGDWPPGYEDYQQWLVGRQRQLEVDNLSFVGWQPDPDAFYRASDLCVLASVNHGSVQIDGRQFQMQGGEGFPRTHLEAMAHGLPIVSTDTAGVREQVVDGLTGRIVQPANPRDLADALETLIADPELRLRMGQAGLERVRSVFSTRNYVDGVMRVYRSVDPHLQAEVSSYRY
jgi:glycosyltransferase involved in cell wall biosynthesis